AEAAKLTAAAPAKPAAKSAAPAAKPPVATPEPAPAPTPAPTEAAAPPPAPRPPARPTVNFGQRTPKPQAPGRAPAERPAFGGRSAREAAMGGGERNYAERPQGARPAEPVRYSALNPRPAPGAARPGGARTGPGGRPTPNQPPAAAEVARPARAGFGRPAGSKAEDDRDKRFSDAGAGKAVSRTRGEPKRREGRLTIQALAGGDEDAAERMRSLASVRRARE